MHRQEVVDIRPVKTVFIFTVGHFYHSWRDERNQGHTKGTNASVQISYILSNSLPVKSVLHARLGYFQVIF